MLKRKDLLGLKDVSKDEILQILGCAVEMKEVLGRDVKKTQHLVGKNVVTLFYENSTRTLLPTEIDKMGVHVCDKIDDAVVGANVVMGLRVQLERQQSKLLPSVSEYMQFYGITQSRLAKADSRAILMHPGPINRDVEISGAAADGDGSRILKQVTGGIAVRMAVMYLLTGGKA